ncbi:hypothetical protein G7K_3037-t1 [Saitoella complicata NRRL Y-17804]|uniref:Uncharacterized protein n=1 Tax=Saitoella complicata (strain BCRC 22490 / CBS 7301 / JCM 7358 / NBRC 10748 / NRRL Y-17804) TaxID=698492 RepID=A0A0E9NGE2_SAICN|nr:hypothetical protein G7K_3037-t1 [Saitoella complicata NRRL Y-17804]
MPATSTDAERITAYYDLASVLSPYFRDEFNGLRFLRLKGTLRHSLQARNLREMKGIQGYPGTPHFMGKSSCCRHETGEPSGFSPLYHRFDLFAYPTSSKRSSQLVYQEHSPPAYNRSLFIALLYYPSIRHLKVEAGLSVSSHLVHQ